MPLSIRFSEVIYCIIFYICYFILIQVCSHIIKTTLFNIYYVSNNTNLINQLVKIKNVVSKVADTNMIQTILVLDGTNGSNMIQQVDKYKNAIGVSGIIITRLDGTAKGGAIIQLGKKYNFNSYRK